MATTRHLRAALNPVDLAARLADLEERVAALEAQSTRPAKKAAAPRPAAEE